MAIEMIECPHCSSRVVPMGNGLCPACRLNIHSDVPEPETDATDARAMNSGLQRTDPTGHDVAGLMRMLWEVEQPAIEQSSRINLRLGVNLKLAGETVRLIRETVLPAYVRAIEDFAGATAVHNQGIVTGLRTRAESWNTLAEALANNDIARYDRYEELRGQSASLLAQCGFGQPAAALTPLQRMKKFQQSLSAFTPRVLVTPAIVLANFAVFLAMVASGVSFFEPTVQDGLDWGGNFGPMVWGGEWWRLISCMFLHFGIVHLGFNMWILWDVGRLVERLVGPVGFLSLYFVSGIAGSLSSLWWHPLIVSGGASGAVFGVVGALLGLILPRRDSIPTPVLQHLAKSVGAFLVLNTVLGLMTPNIDMAAHTGGLVAGVISGFILSQPLSALAVSRRWKRNLLVSFAGGATLLLWAVFMKQATPSLAPPACTDQEVVQLLEKMIQRTLVDAQLISIRNNREVSFDADADIRYGECIAQTDTHDIVVNYVVEWQDRDKGFFQVRIPAQDLPLCTDAEVVNLVGQLIQKSDSTVELTSIEGHREVDVEPDGMTRYGECTVRSESGDRTVNYVVEWLDPDENQYRVRIPPIDLPACTDPEVMRLLERLIRDSFPAWTLKSVDGHRDTGQSNDDDIRIGECVAHTEASDIPLRYQVAWQDRRRGFFEVQLAVRTLPACTDTEVMRVLEDVIRKDLVDSEIEAIDRHREISFDAEAEVRYGDCVVHSETGDITVGYSVEWEDRNMGLFEVQAQILQN